MKQMEKLYSQILGTPILARDSHKPVARVHDLILDPENGNLIALALNTKWTKVVATRDIVEFKHYITIHDLDDICDVTEVLRISEIKKRKIKIFRNRVETEKGEYLGKVFDYSIETKTASLKKLFVSKSLLGLFRVESRIISRKYIVEMTPDKIVVKDTLAKIPIEELFEEARMEEEFSSV